MELTASYSIDNRSRFATFQIALIPWLYKASTWPLLPLRSDLVGRTKTPFGLHRLVGARPVYEQDPLSAPYSQGFAVHQRPQFLLRIAPCGVPYGGLNTVGGPHLLKNSEGSAWTRRNRLFRPGPQLNRNREHRGPYVSFSGRRIAGVPL